MTRQQGPQNKMPTGSASPEQQAPTQAQPQPKPGPGQPPPAIFKPPTAASGGTTMSGHIGAVVEAAQQYIGGFDPQSRSDVHGFMTELPELYREIGGALHQAADKLSQMPAISPAVVESLHELGAVTSGLADTAEQTSSAHLTDHDVWLED